MPLSQQHQRAILGTRGIPATYGGFGMPPLEAIASGVPGISSDSTSISEVAGDAAVLVDPGDINALAQAIDHLLTDQVFYTDMQQRGFKQVEAFVWSASAECVRDVYVINRIKDLKITTLVS